MKVLRFLLDYWYVPLLALGAVIGAIFVTRAKRGTALPVLTLKTELAAIEAKRDARAVRLHRGAEAAKQHVLTKYALKRKSLDERAEARVRALEDDPEQLAKTLERLTR